MQPQRERERERERGREWAREWAVMACRRRRRWRWLRRAPRSQKNTTKKKKKRKHFCWHATPWCLLRSPKAKTEDCEDCADCEDCEDCEATSSLKQQNIYAPLWHVRVHVDEEDVKEDDDVVEEDVDDRRPRSFERSFSSACLPGSNVTRCVKIIDFPWLDCCWLSKFNHNMQKRDRERLEESGSCRSDKLLLQHVAKLTTWIFNFASQQRQVICCVDVPGVADEQWPGQPAARTGQKTDQQREREGERQGGRAEAARRVDQFILMQTTHINSCAAADMPGPGPGRGPGLDARSTDWRVPFPFPPTPSLSPPILLYKQAPSRVSHSIRTASPITVVQSAKKFINLSATHLLPTVRRHPSPPAVPHRGTPGAAQFVSIVSRGGGVE